MSGNVSISEREYNLIKDLVYQKFGIHLGDQKQALVFGRLQKILRLYQFKNLEQYHQFIMQDKSGEGLNTLINSLSTNHTYFYREPAHFDFFVERTLPEVNQAIKTKKDPSVRVWSAGCSFGEEPYTLAMLMLEFFGTSISNGQLGVLATDISERALAKGAGGVYDRDNVEKLPAHFAKRYFRKTTEEEYSVIPKLKDIVLFRRLNLMRTSFPFRHKFHTIFCRNVMIYFDAPTRDLLVRRFYEYLDRDGYLFIGHSESLGRTNEFFEYIQPAVYKKIS